MPCDQAMTSSGIASMRSVGFDSGSTIGRCTPAHIASMTSRVNALWSVEVPMRIVGLAWRTTSSRPIAPSLRAQSLTSLALRAYACW